MSEDILSPAQRAELRAFTAAANSASTNGQGNGDDDAALLGAAAERIGMTGELAVDPEGGLELERDGILVALDTVAEEDTAEVEHPELLHVAVYVRPDSGERRVALQQAELLDGDDDLEQLEGGWLYTWWGGGCTTLPRTLALPDQMQALERIMTAAEDAIEAMDVNVYDEAVGELYMGDEDGEFE